MIQWERFLPSVPRVSSFFWSLKPNTSSLDRIKKLIQELSYPKPQPIYQRKITTEFWPSPSLIWGNFLYLLLSWKRKFLSSSTNPVTQLKTLLVQNCIEKKTLVERATHIFGQRLIAAVQKTIDSFPDLVTKKELCRLFAVIGYKLTTSDIKNLLKKVNDGEIPLELSRRMSNNIQDLPSRDIKTLIDFFHNPPKYLLPNEEKTLEIESKKAGILANTEYECYVRQLTGNTIERQMTEEDLKIFPFAVSEQLARIVAYASLENEEIIVPIFTEQQDVTYYQLKNQIKEKGLHCYLFTPLQEDLPAQLVFKGTDDKESLFRDVLDLKGIGKTVFDECKPKIAKMIEDYCQTTKNPSLKIIGHSLGGLDAQRALILCLEQLNQENNNGSFSRLSHIDCFAFCSAKLDRATIKSWEDQLENLKNHSTAPQMSLNFAYHRDDALTRVGYKNLYIPQDKKGLEFLQENYLQVYSKSGILGTNGHHREPFFKEGRFHPSVDDRKYISYKSIDLVDLEEKIGILQDLIDQDSQAKILLKEDLKIVEFLNQKLAKMRENQKEICSYQEGFSSDSSWTAFFAYQLLIAPGQYLFHWIKETRFSDSYWMGLFAYKLSASRQSLSHWVQSHSRWIKPYWLKA